MKNRSKEQLIFLSHNALSNFAKNIRRQKKKHKRKLGRLKFEHDVLITLRRKKPLSSFKWKPRKIRNSNVKKPDHSTTIKFLASLPSPFSKENLPKKENGHFIIPAYFSLSETDAYSDSFLFLKRLFYALYYEKAVSITLDYKNCKHIDVDASVCMDIMLRDFVTYNYQCNKRGANCKIKSIRPINYNQPHILKILFSIGAFANIKGFSIKFDDIIAYPLSVGHLKSDDSPEIREVHITQLVDYVLLSMDKMNRTLTPEATDSLYKVIGEVLINAEEHSTTEKRYSIGYFQDKTENGEHIGIFNLVILNFGKTIYEKFNDPDCPNIKVKNQMKELSEKYTQKGLFTKAEFEQQTLWTLYALQEGVTSHSDWKRGNGSIRFIESFFNLKGDQKRDNISRLTIVSGNTHIIFDGEHRIIEKAKGKENKTYKMMTFNEKGDIENKPDKKYVIFAENYFPGTIISAKICIKENITEILNSNE